MSGVLSSACRVGGAHADHLPGDDGVEVYLEGEALLCRCLVAKGDTSPEPHPLHCLPCIVSATANALITPDSSSAVYTKSIHV